MPNNETAKTEWAPKRRLWLLAGVTPAIAALLLALGWWVLRSVEYTIQAGDTRYTVDIANDTQERTKGLSGRESLPENHGMVFIFPQPGQRCIWMKDMHFPLDIIWLDEQKRVIDILEHVSPATYPSSFCPSTDALYVLELNAGQAQKAGIRQGKAVGFSNF